MTRRSGDAGFTLVETLIALAIMALALPAFYRAMANSYRASSVSRIQEAALQVARSRLNWAVAADGLKPGLLEGETNGINWRHTVTGISADTNPNASSASYWLVLETYSSTGGRLVKLETSKIQRLTR